MYVARLGSNSLARHGLHVYWVGMYIATVPNRGSPPALLLREGYREDGKVKTRTLANLSHLPPETIEVVRRSLRGEKLIAFDQAFEVVDSRLHGHVNAVLRASKVLGKDNIGVRTPGANQE